MVDLKFEAPLGAPIDSEEQARDWVMRLVTELETERRRIDLILDVVGQRRALDQYRIRFGNALGVLVALQRCRKIGDVAYNGLRERVMQTATPTVTVYAGER